jgi:hypothetical protein
MSPRSVLFSLFAFVFLFLTEHAIAGSNLGSLSASTIFREPPVYPSGGNGTGSVALGDLNGDGRLDMVVANGCVSGSQCGSMTAGSLDVLLGNGDGTFQAPVSYFTGSTHVSFATIADVNDDGRPDLLVGGSCPHGDCSAGGTVAVLLGNGDGTFQAALVFSAPSGAGGAIVVADVNNDGKPDVIAAGGTLGVFLGNGDGTLQPEVTYSGGGFGTVSVAVADVNGDGKLDLIAVNQQMVATSNGGIGVLLGNGDGSFQPAVTYLSGGQNAVSAVVGDVNRDGRLDVVVGNNSINGNIFTGGVGVLFGNGDGTFQAAVTLAAGGASSGFLLMLDVNADGNDDLLVSSGCQANSSTTNCSNGIVSVLLGNGDGSFQPPVRYTSGDFAGGRIAAGDVNGDARTDVVVANASSLGVLLGNADGSFQSARVFSSGVYPDTSEVTADLNGDGKQDLLIANLCASTTTCPSGGVGVLLGNGDGTFQPPAFYVAGAFRANSIAIADLNGDGKPDVVVAKQCIEWTCSTGTIGVLLGNGDGTLQNVVDYSSGGQYAYSVAVADVNGDGKPDVLIGNECASSSSCGNGVLGVLLGNGDGSLRSAVTYPSGGQYAVSLAVADVNRDGKQDAILGNYYTTSGDSNGALGVLLGNGDGTFRTPTVHSSGGTGDNSVTVADVNGDGQLDLIAGNQCGATCSNGVIDVHLGNGDGTFQSPIASITPIINSDYFEPVVLADFDGDGKLDLASAVSNFLMLGNGDGTFQAPLLLGAGGVGIAVGDFNRDGKPDVAVGGVTVLLNATHSSTATTTTNLASSLNPSGYGQQVTLTATVTPSSSGTPTGTVTFYDGTTALGTGTLSSNNASLNGVIFAAGSHTITASYAGDSNVEGSTSPALSQTVSKATTATGVTSSANPSYLKQSVTFTATVTGQFGAAVTGSVTFKQGTTNLATVSLSNGQASYTTTYTSVGTRAITAVYSGDSNNLTSTSTVLNQTVTRVPTSTAVSSSLNPAFIGDSVTFTATVTARNTSLGLPAPIGNVTFRNGGALLGTSPLNGSTATFTTSSLPAGNLSITATYNGDANYIASTSPTLAQTVKRLPTTTSLSVNINPSAYGQTIQFAATVDPSSGNGTPTGTVTFKSGTATLATVPLNNGVAIYNNSNLAVGTKSITAVYNGGSTYASSTSSALSQVINKVATTTALTSSANPSSFGQSVTFTAAVSPQYSGTPTGSVTFKLGATILQTVTLSGGSASYTTTTLPRGSDNISATYNASASFITSSGSLTQQVN